MSNQPYGTTTFCDDIRHEVNGKITLVGCYSSELNFNGPAPGILPTFAALINIRIPTSQEFNFIKLVVIKEEAAGVSEILNVELRSDEPEFKKVLDIKGDLDADEKIISMTVPAQWSNVAFSASGYLKARAYLNGTQEIRLGVIKINFSFEDTE